MKFTRKAQLALTAAAAAAPLALALPAQASTTSSLCAVTPQAPAFHVVATYKRTSTGRHEVVQRRCGIGASEPGQAAS